jgi:hypothetical protein
MVSHLSVSNTFTNTQLACIHRAFIIAILAMISIGCQNFLFSSAAASLSSKLRSLSLRAILRQDSKLVSERRNTLSSHHNLPVEYFDRDEHSVRAVFTKMYLSGLTVYSVWCYRIQVERGPTKDLWLSRRHSWSVRTLNGFLCMYTC